jgi:3-oxoacyl-[acyl-carrier protein] reductase
MHLPEEFWHSLYKKQNPFHMNIKDIKAIVTGGSSGIGLEIAKQMIEKGAKVLITGRDEKKLKNAATAIGAHYAVADASNEKQVIDAFEKAKSIMNGYNVLINNAAYGAFGLLKDQDTKVFEAILATNVTGAMIAGREAAKHFIENNFGNIINISSTAGNAGFAGGTAYVASKFALKGMTECWRAELRKSNIRVMLVNPSEVQTPFYQALGGERPFNPSKLEASEIAHLVVAMLTMRDVGFITEATVFATNPK